MTAQNPVLLIHGIQDTIRVFDKMVAYLRDRGWDNIHTLNLVPNNGDVGLDKLALQVESYIATHMAQAETFDLLGFSMGGMVSRYYVQRLGGAQRVRRFITLSSPHNGTWTAYFRQNPGVCQMRSDSQFLQDLNGSLHELRQVEFTSIWTPYDLMILPAKSSQLPIGQTIQLPVLAHPWMLTDRRSLEVVAKVLGNTTTRSQQVASLAL
ncbi:MAG: alpha/beta fold hydrolase [Leptolyngbya sp. SIO1D8]|nr:alpha/beta fold hydrolase [Leptolyngbya sp. SIO1D8]